jgi:large subunit ribosomal protein L6
VSRIGKAPVPIPDGVKVDVNGSTVKVTGTKGTLEQEFNSQVNIALVENELVVTRPNDKPDVRALHGLTRALINNMVVGVTQGYEKVLEIHGVGWRATMEGKKLNLQLGFSHPVLVEPLEGIEFSVDGNTTIKVSGYDKQRVGQMAAKVRAWRKPEPYKGKGIRYQGEHVRRKVGKQHIKSVSSHVGNVGCARKLPAARRGPVSPCVVR